ICGECGEAHVQSFDPSVLLFSSGFTVERTTMILFSMSNQKGAPSVTAKAVRSQPISASHAALSWISADQAAPLPRLCRRALRVWGSPFGQPSGMPRELMLSNALRVASICCRMAGSVFADGAGVPEAAGVAAVWASGCALVCGWAGVEARGSFADCAAATMAWRNVGSLESWRTMAMVLAFMKTAMLMPMMKSAVWMRDLYRPDTRSMPLLYQSSMFFWSLLLSLPAIAIIETSGLPTFSVSLFLARAFAASFTSWPMVRQSSTETAMLFPPVGAGWMGGAGWLAAAASARASAFAVTVAAALCVSTTASSRAKAKFFAGMYDGRFFGFLRSKGP